MCSPRFAWLLLFAGNALAAEGFIIGAGVEGDSADGLAGTVVADVALTEKTWLSGSIGGNSVELPRNQSIDTWYGDLGIDHWFEPVGVRVGAAYWGDSDILDSQDWRASLYWQNDRMTLAGDYEYRDFTFQIPQTDFFPGRTINFDANGVGLTTRFDVTDTVTVSLSGMAYDYSLDLRLANNRGLLELLSFSRLSLINSLVDHRVFAGIGVDVGERHWQFDVGTWQGEVDGGRSRSATVRFMTPLGKATDVEFGLGLDDSDLYGSVTFFSVFLYFYGDS